MDMEVDVLIIGAGLSGLSAAYYLRNSGKQVAVVDARDRIGGRIQTLGYPEKMPIEMGATWLGVKHQNLVRLIHELGLETFEQKMGDKAIYEAISTSPPYLVSLPENPEPSLRIKGGTFALIDALTKAIGENLIELNTSISRLEDHQDHIVALAERLTIKAKKVITTLPPNLLIHSIDLHPTLPETLVDVCKETQTWMGESIKVALTFREPFWRAEHLSGTIFSNAGPIPEMYDHTNFEESFFALKGFLNGAYHSLSREERLEKVLIQLQKYYGEKANDFISYHETVWVQEENTYAPYDSHVLPHQNNGHELYQQPYFGGRLIISGSETSTQFPGYMDGAVVSGKRASEMILA